GRSPDFRAGPGSTSTPSGPPPQVFVGLDGPLPGHCLSCVKRHSLPQLGTEVLPNDRDGEPLEHSYKRHDGPKSHKRHELSPEDTLERFETGHSEETNEQDDS